MTSTLALVHGAWQGNYSWFMVKEKLEKMGYHVTAISLHGHGDNPRDTKGLTLNSYCEAVIEEINKITGKVFLVGHSMGDMVISGVAEMIPEKIEGMVYMAAYVPESGKALTDLRIQNANSAIKGNTELSLEEGTIDVIKDKVLEIFYHDATPYHDLAMKMHHAQPIDPFETPVVLTEARYGQIDKYYIHALHDKAIPHDFEQTMANRITIKETFTLPTAHIPQLVMPDELVGILDGLATTTNQ